MRASRHTSLISGIALATMLAIAAPAFAQDASPSPSPSPTSSADAGPPGDAPHTDKDPKKKPKDKKEPLAPPRGPAPPDNPPEPTVRTDPAPAPKRRLQDYEGRPHKTSVGQDLLWIPRVVLFPVYVFSDFVVRRPLGAMDIAVEENDVISKLQDTFTFGPHNNVGIVPTALVDFGFRPSVGLYHFYDDFLFDKNNLVATISTGGSRYLKAAVADRVPLHVKPDGTIVTYLQLEIDGFARPDLKFYGIGPSSLKANLGRYEMRTAGGGLRVNHEFWKGTFLQSWANVRRVDFADGKCDPVNSLYVEPQTTSCDATTILEQVKAGRYPIPAGFRQGYVPIKLGARLVLDSRPQRPKPGSGVAIDARVEHGTVLSGETHGSWIAYGASLGGFVDLTGTRRVLGLIVDARFEDNLQPRFQIPFTELIGTKRFDSVPEDDLLRGFLPGRLLGRSSATAALEYEWPIWAFLDGTLQAAVGNVFDEHLKDFKFERTRLSFVGGITTPNHRDHQFNLLLGFGTRTFEQGAAPDSIRFLLGGTTGF